MRQLRVQVLVAREVRPDDDEVQQLAVLGLEVAQRTAVAVLDDEAPLSGRAGAERGGLWAQRRAGQLGAQPVGAGHGLDHRLAAVPPMVEAN